MPAVARATRSSAVSTSGAPIPRNTQAPASSAPAWRPDPPAPSHRERPPDQAARNASGSGSSVIIGTIADTVR
jgi:hypothetical protein